MNLLQPWNAVFLVGFIVYVGIRYVFAAMYFLRTPREERLMCESFGNEYRDYLRQTGRLFPRMQMMTAAKKSQAEELASETVCKEESSP